jgi:hypothetical protein
LIQVKWWARGSSDTPGIKWRSRVNQRHPRGWQRRPLEQLQTGDGRALPAHLKAQIGRELDRAELLLEQIKVVEAETEPAAEAPRVTKQQIVVDLLKRPEGASTQELVDATGWLPHTVRAVISGINNGRSGKREIQRHPIESVRKDGATVYRIIEPAA